MYTIGKTLLRLCHPLIFKSYLSVNLMDFYYFLPQIQKKKKENKKKKKYYNTRQVHIAHNKKT